MRDRPSSSPVDLFISSTKMASTASTNVNELLPGLESFLRSMLNSTHLDTDHRQIAAMYVDKLDQLGKFFDPSQSHQPASVIDDQSLINTEIVSDDDSDDFTDEEEEQRKEELKEQQLLQQQQLSTPTTSRLVSSSDNQLYHSTRRQSSLGSSQWYIDVPKNGYLEASNPPLSHDHHEGLSSKAPSRLSIATSTTPSSSTIIADGLLLTYDENHNWIWRYYVLDDFDLICFPADKKQVPTDNDSAPLWVSDMTKAKVHTTVIEKTECLCLQIGLAEAIYVRPPDPTQMHVWLKAFRDASSSKRSKENVKGRSNVKTLSRNARRVFAQFNRKKGQIVSHLLDQMANVTGVDDKTRKHCELRGFLVVSLDNQTFVTKYCTIVDGIFRVHKSRLSEQTDHEFSLNHCTLSFPEERTRDIQFALIDEQVGTIFIRGNNIYSMGRLLNTLAKYVEITGKSQFAFPSPESETSTPVTQHRQATGGSSQSHIYSDVEASGTTAVTAQSNEIYAPSSVKSVSTPQSVKIKRSIYHNASKLHDDHNGNDQAFVVPVRQPSLDPPNSETYDRPKSYDNIAVMTTPTTVDRNNNHVVLPVRRRGKSKTEDETTCIESRPSTSNSTHSHRSKSKSSHSNRSIDPPSVPSSPENTVFCLRASDSSSSSHHHQRRRPNPLPRRSSTQTTPSEYVNKLANLFTKSFSTASPSSPKPTNDHHISTQTYDTISSSSSSSTYPHSSISPRSKTPVRSPEPPTSRRVYDIPITIERPTKRITTPFEQYQKPTIRSSRSVEPLSTLISKQDDDDDNNNHAGAGEEETPYSQGYDNLAKNDGIGKFRFVVPFNHSPTSAFTPSSKVIHSPTNSSSSTISSYSTQRSILSSAVKNNANLNTTNSTSRSTLMTAV